MAVEFDPLLRQVIINAGTGLSGGPFSLAGTVLPYIVPAPTESIATSETFFITERNLIVTSDYINLQVPVIVANGGTGDTSFTPYAVICGGTTSTSALQSIASVGSSGQVLTSNGASALPTFQAAASGTVTSVSGTTNQIVVTPSSPNPVVSLSTTIVTPGTLTVEANSATAFVVESTTPTSYFKVNTSSGAVSTANNTLDDGSGNATILESLTVDNTLTVKASSVLVNTAITYAGQALTVNETSLIPIWYVNTSTPLVSNLAPLLIEYTATNAFVVESATPTVYFKVDTSTPQITASCNTTINGLGTVDIYASIASGTGGTLNLYANSTSGAGTLTIQGGNSSANYLNNQVNINAGGSGGGQLTLQGGSSSTATDNQTFIYGASGPNPGNLTIQAGNSSTTPLTTNLNTVSGGGSNGGTLQLYGGTSGTVTNNVVVINSSSDGGIITGYDSLTIKSHATSNGNWGQIFVSGINNGASTAGMLTLTNTSTTNASTAGITFTGYQGGAVSSNITGGVGLNLTPSGTSGAVTFGVSGTNCFYNPNVANVADTCTVYEFQINSISNAANTFYNVAYPSGFTEANIRYMYAVAVVLFSGATYVTTQNFTLNTGLTFGVNASSTDMYIYTGPSWDAVGTGYLWVWFN